MKKAIVLTGITISLGGAAFIYIKTGSLAGVLLYEILLLLFMEIALRIFIVGEFKYGWKSGINQRLLQNFSKPKMASFKGHPYALYVKIPDAGGLYPSNNLGYTGKRPVSIKKSSGKVRIYVVGGSTVEGIDPAQGPDSHWPAKVQDLLNERFKGEVTEVINAGAAAYTSAESFSEFAFRGIDLNPDILLIYHNVNDVGSIQMTDGFKSDYSHIRVQKPWKLSWAHSLPNLRFILTYQLIRNSIIGRFGTTNALMFQISNPPWKSTEDFDEDRVRVFKRNIRNMIAVAQINFVKPIIVKWECDWGSDWVPAELTGSPKAVLLRKLIRYLEANNRALQELAAEHNLPFIDVGPFAPDCFSDHVHFNAKGLDEMASRISRQIYPFIKDMAVKSK